MTKGDVFRSLIVLFVVVGVVAIAWINPAGVEWKLWLSPQAILSAAGIIVGFVIMSWQLKRQHWNTLDNNRRQSQDRLNVELYNKLADRIEATTTPLTKVGLIPSGFMVELAIREHRVAAGRALEASRAFAELDDQQRATTDSVISLMSVLETHEIVMRQFAEFRNELGRALQSLNECVNGFKDAARPFSGTAPPLWPADQGNKDSMKSLADSAQDTSIGLVGVIWDLRVAAQNYLLGRLFPGQTVPPRAPGDPSIKVTTLPSG